MQLNTGLRYLTLLMFLDTVLVFSCKSEIAMCEYFTSFFWHTQTWCAISVKSSGLNFDAPQ